ncbi:MAG: hypothetical protein IPN59_06485 [Holophaga sp.]|nr:hypothetical protein [Holophaga sp.]
MLAMWVPELPFQLACGREGGLEGRPLAFLNPEQPRTPTLWFVNRLAKAEGVRAGEPMDQALRRLPGLRVLDPAPQTWWEAHAYLGDFLVRWTPQGQLGRMGEAMVELHGTEGLYGPPRDAAWRIRRELQGAHGWLSHGGLSESATAAHLAAHLEHELEQVTDGGESGFLAPQPLKNLPDLAPRLRARFRRLGLLSFGDAQPLPLPTWSELVPAALAPKLRSQVRGEDRVKLPLLTERPGSSRHSWRQEPPRLPEEIELAAWTLNRLWADPRSPRTLSLRWWDVDGETHFWRAPETALTEPPLNLARALEAAFRAGSTRRILVRQVELRIAWGLGRPRSLFPEPRTAKLDHLEPALARLRKRYPENPVLPGWMVAV